MARTKATARKSTAAGKKAPKKTTTKKVVSSGSGSGSKKPKSGVFKVTRTSKSGKEYTITQHWKDGKLVAGPGGKAKAKSATKISPGPLGNRLIKASAAEGKQGNTGVMVWEGFSALVKDLAKAINDRAKAKGKAASYAYFRTCAYAVLKEHGLYGERDEFVLESRTKFATSKRVNDGLAKGAMPLELPSTVFAALVEKTALGKVRAQIRKPMQYFCEEVVIQKINDVYAEGKGKRLTREQVSTALGVADAGEPPKKAKKAGSGSASKTTKSKTTKSKTTKAKAAAEEKPMTKDEVIEAIREAKPKWTVSALKKFKVDELRDMLAAGPGSPPPKKKGGRAAVSKPASGGSRKKATTKKATASRKKAEEEDIPEDDDDDDDEPSFHASDSTEEDESPAASTEESEEEPPARKGKGKK